MSLETVRNTSSKHLNRNGFAPTFITSVTSALHTLNLDAAVAQSPSNDPLDLFESSPATSNPGNTVLSTTDTEVPVGSSFVQLFGGIPSAATLTAGVGLLRAYGQLPSVSGPGDWIPLMLYPLDQVPVYDIPLDPALLGSLLSNGRTLFGGPSVYLSGCNRLLILVKTAVVLDDGSGTVPVLGRYFS